MTVTQRDPRPHFDYNQTIQAHFEQFHRKHPEVLQHLLGLIKQAQQAGRKRIGIAQLFEVLRWERMIAGLPDQGEAFKLNNNYRSRYARYIMDNYPSTRGMFVTRELKSP